MVRRYELEDWEWEAIQPCLPKRKRMGRPPRDAREVLNGVFWILRAGAPWRDLPDRYGPWETVYVDAQGQPLGKRESGMPR